jgi:hypothetical protein
LDDKVQVERKPSDSVTEIQEEKPVDRTPEISPERIQRMKRAFKPTWLQEQINSAVKNGKKE